MLPPYIIEELRRREELRREETSRPRPRIEIERPRPRVPPAPEPGDDRGVEIIPIF